MKLTERDRKIIEKLQTCECLTTGQVARLFFPGVSLSAVRQRLAKLCTDKVLKKHQSHQMSEGVYLPYGDKPPKQYEPLSGLNEIRIAIESSQREVSYFYAYWELAKVGWDFHVIPDAVCKVDGERYLIEYDRSTEPVSYLKQKVIMYEDLDFDFDKVVIFCDTNARIKSFSKSLKYTGKDYYLIFLLSEIGNLVSDYGGVASTSS